MALFSKDIANMKLPKLLRAHLINLLQIIGHICKSSIQCQLWSYFDFGNLENDY